MTTHSSILAWKIPWTEKLGRPQSMGSLSQTGLSLYTNACVHAHTHQIFVERLPQPGPLLGSTGSALANLLKNTLKCKLSWWLRLGLSTQRVQI